MSEEQPADLGGGVPLVTGLEPAALASVLAAVAGDAGLRAGMRAAGPAQAAPYTWDGAAERLWRAYRDLV